MHAALNLVSLNDVTHTAVRNGDWDNPRTWRGGKIPSENAKVHIPNGITVTYGAVSDIRHDTVRVDGVLEFESDESSKMILDTMVVSKDGELIIGKDTNPIQSKELVDIVFRSDTDINKNGDPTQLRRGLLSMGKVTIVGADKLDHVKLKQPALKGDSVLVLDLPDGQEQPQGWKVGDRLVLGGTRYNFNGADADNSRFQDEVLEITNIEGNTIRFRNLDITGDNNNQLRFNHTVPDIIESEELNLYVANTSRNITFSSENGQDTAVERRGHIMLMQNPDVVVKNSGFVGLGRSDKSKLVDDPEQNLDGSNGNGTNPRGRYALHLHRMTNNTLAGDPAILSGNAIVGSPGWGIVAHSSKAKITDNVVFDIVGAGIVAEGGDEQGSWNNNIVIKTTGVDRQVVLKTESDRDRLFDFGFKGDAYWIQGAAQVALNDNIAISSNETGLTIFGDSLRPDQDVRDAKTIAVSELPAELQNVVPAGQEYVDITDVPLRQLDGFTSYNSKVGLRLWGHMFNSDGEGEFTSPTPKTAHTLRSQISNFALWGNRWRGLHVEYSSQIDFNNGLILGTSPNNKSVGILSNKFAFNNTFDNLNVQQFSQGFTVPLNGPQVTGNDYLKSTLSNSKFKNNSQHLSHTKQHNSSGVVDDFPEYFNLVNTQFSSQQSNQAPMASFSTDGSGGLGVHFNAQASSDTDQFSAGGESAETRSSRGIVAYAWDFDNDGKVDSFGRTARHQYNTPGDKTVRLTVVDNQGRSTTLSQSVQVSSTPYQNPFIDSSFNKERSFLAGAKSNHLASNQGWYATREVRRANTGFAELSSPSSFSGAVGQIIKNDYVHRGEQNLEFKLKNIEGSEPHKYWLNNEITIQLWGINGQFNNVAWETDGPQKIGNLPFQATNLFTETIGGRDRDSTRQSFDWRNYSHKVDLGKGYQFLMFQVNTLGTRDVGDIVGIDDISLSADAPAILPTSPEPKVIIPAQGTKRNDDINGSSRNDILRGFRGNDRISGNNGNDRLIGGPGSDTLLGGAGDDILVGATRASGENDIDTFVGGIGKDRFVLGNRSFQSYKNKIGDGSSSFAWIKDFNTNSDKIQLKGSRENYRVEALSIKGYQGIGISLHTEENSTSTGVNDLIGFIEGLSTLDLSSKALRYL